MNEKLPEKIINQLKRVEDRMDNSLSRLTVSKFENGILYFSFCGHEVGGSYVYDYQVAPSYIKAIELETNLETKWLSRRVGGFGFDVYHFSLNTKKVVDENKYQPIGTLIYMDNCVAFSNENGEVFDYLYNIVKSLKKGNKIEGVFLDSDILYFKDIKVCKVLDLEPEKTVVIEGHNIQAYRTQIKATFDLFLKEKDFLKLYYEQCKKNINKYFKENQLNFRCDLVSISGRYLEVFLNIDKSFIFKRKDLIFLEKEFYAMKIFFHTKALADYNYLYTLFDKEKEKYFYFKKKEEIYNSENEEFKKYIILMELISEDKVEEVKKNIKDFKTPQNYDNRYNLNDGYSPIDFFKFAKSKEMREVLYNWMSLDLKEDYFPVYFDTFEEEVSVFKKYLSLFL